MSDRVQCSGNGCGAWIVWRFTERGKRMCLDAEPTDLTGAGVYVLEGNDRCRKHEPLLDGDRPRYLAHWANCPDRDRFKRKTR